MFRRLLSLLGVLALVMVTGTAAQAQADDTVTWSANYWNNINLNGIPAVERSETTLDYSWGFSSPVPGEIDANNFSAEWATRDYFEPGVYEFTTRSDDGIRVWVGGSQLIDNWDRHAVETDTAYMTVQSGQLMDIRVEYFEATGVATASIDWQRVNDLPESDTVSATINPTSGAPGTVVALTATGFPANIGVEIGVGRVASEYDIVALGTTNDGGILNTTVQIPEFAGTGEEWVAVVVTGDNALQAVSNAFAVTSPDEATCESPYTVQAGDTLYDIAQRCRVLLDDLIAANDFILNPNLILPGEELVIPEPDEDADPAPTFTSVSFYLIELGAGDIGCGDALVQETVSVEPTATPLTTALNILLGYESETYYNALDEADAVTVEEIAISDEGEATIALEGDINVAGICDNPRILAQLRETALQYTTINSVSYTLNGTPLDELY